MKDIVKEQIKNLPVYETGKPIEYVAREFGLDPDGILKMASNENPLGSSPKALEAVRKYIDTLNYYPDGGCYELRQKLSKFWNLQPNQFAFGNGSNELLEFIAQCYVGEGDGVRVVRERHKGEIQRLVGAVGHYHVVVSHAEYLRRLFGEPFTFGVAVELESLRAVLRRLDHRGRRGEWGFVGVKFYVFLILRLLSGCVRGQSRQTIGKVFAHFEFLK